MATIILTAVGSYFGPIGAMVGGAIGSYIDQTLLAKDTHQEGPKLSDKRIQSSSYGSMIPIVRGSMGVSGNIIWASDLQEESNTEESGGGGKGGPSNTTTLYSYFANFAVSLCEGPMHSVSRIWANGRLWFDSTATDQGYTDWRFYSGSETQTPDPTIEAFKGVGNVPAYRGQCHVVFTRMPVSQFGNMIPQMMFEVNEQAAVTHSIETIRTFTPYTWNHTPVIAFGTDGHLWQWEYFESGGDISQLNPDDGTVIGTWPVAPGDYRALLFAVSAGRFWGWIAPPNDQRLVLINPNSQSYIRAANITATGYEEAPIQGCTLGDDFLMLSKPPSSWAAFPCRVNASSVSTVLKGPDIGVVGMHWAFMDGIDGQHMRGATDGTSYYVVSMDNPGGSHYRLYKIAISTMTVTTMVVPPTTTGGANGRMALYHNGKLYTTTDDQIDRWDPVTMTHQGRLLVPLLCSVITVAEDPRFFIAGHTPNSNNLTVIDVASFTVLGNIVTPISQAPSEMGKDPLTNRLYGIGYGANTYTLYRIHTAALGPEPIPLDSIVSRYCERAGLTAAQIDVTQLASVGVRGTVIARQCAVRQAIEPMQRAYFFDGVESGAKIKFIKRGGASAMTIPDDDLAQVGAQDVPRLTIKRAQDVDLPRTINIMYFEPSRDYQPGTQYARRFGGFSNNDVSSDIPIAMDSNEAKAIAESWLYNGWMERQQFQFALPIKYAALEPTDLITLHGFLMRLQKRTEDGLLIKFDATNDSSQIYTQPDRGVDGSGAGNQIPPTAHPSRVLYLDIPLLRDVDDIPGFYIAANGIPTPNWPGVSIYKSFDAGQTFVPYYATTAPCTFGVALTALGNWQAKNNTVDEHNTVSVEVNGALSSITLLALLNGGNPILIGNEVLQFRDATLTAPNTYTLRGLLRGRQGTEWANGTHAINDRVVLLTTNLRNVTHDASEIGAERIYKQTTIGQPLELGETTAFTDTGVRHECYAPCDIGGGQHTPAVNDWTLFAKRRTRLSDGWQDLIDAPLGEALERYEIQIMNGLLAIRSFDDLTTPEVVYTEAQQITDWGSVQTSLTVKWYQVSALRGRGYPGESAIPPP